VATDVALFWALLVAFLVADNLALAPAGGDFLRFGFGGRLRYEPHVRLKVRGRDLVVLNPANPFDRLLFTRHAAGYVRGEQLRASSRVVRSPLRGSNRLAMVGSAYLASLVLLAAASTATGFGIVLAALAAVHVAAWSASVAIAAAWRERFGLSRYQLFVLATEALFVPAYTVNLSKRIWRRRVLDVPAMAWGLRSIRRIADPSMRELYCLRMSGRLDDVAAELDLSDAADPATSDSPLPVPSSLHRQSLVRWVSEARQCLTKSAPQGGW
jgi:hypothetical protein